MKNSVADRSNAQSSCAAQFIGNHLEVTCLINGFVTIANRLGYLGNRIISPVVASGSILIWRGLFPVVRGPLDMV